MPEYEAVIGLEVHVQVRTASKLFCGCPNEFGAEPNTDVCPVCLGYPGVLPVINREAIRKTLAAGLMCNSNIQAYSKFDRKNYFYPDMPKNYQISQYDLPICLGGAITIGGKGFSGDPLPTKTLGITRIHLEEDVAKSTHMGARSAIDFNRAGVPLMEVVSEPDMRTPDEAYAYLTALKQIMQYAEISDCDMEKGQLRCDVNVSVRPVGQETFGEKIEIKNLNSFRAIHRSLGYEIERQIMALQTGEPLRQETRRWDDVAGVTSVMRTKEHAHDYRYFPEPDLMPVNISDQWRNEIAAALPEKPDARRLRLVTQYGVTEYDAHVLTLEKALADYYEQTAGTCPNAKAAANWIMTDLLRELRDADRTIADSPVTPEHLAGLIRLIDDNTISGRIAKDVFAEMFGTGRSPDDIVAEKGLRQVSDTGAIEQLAQQVIDANPGPVAEYKAGKTKAIQFLMGQVMKLSRGKANPQLAVQTLKKLLDRS